MIRPDSRALANFSRAPTPHGAIMLAIADHKAYAGRAEDVEFVRQLRVAAEIVKAAGQLGIGLGPCTNKLVVQPRKAAPE